MNTVSTGYRLRIPICGTSCLLTRWTLYREVPIFGVQAPTELLEDASDWWVWSFVSREVSKINPIVFALGTTNILSRAIGRSYLAEEIPSEYQECWMERGRRDLPVGRNLDRLCPYKCGWLACKASEYRALAAIRGYKFELDISSKTKWPCTTYCPKLIKSIKSLDCCTPKSWIQW